VLAGVLEVVVGVEDLVAVRVVAAVEGLVDGLLRRPAAGQLADGLLVRRRVVVVGLDGLRELVARGGPRVGARLVVVREAEVRHAGHGEVVGVAAARRRRRGDVADDAQEVEVLVVEVPLLLLAHAHLDEAHGEGRLEGQQRRGHGHPDAPVLVLLRVELVELVRGHGGPTPRRNSSGGAEGGLPRRSFFTHGMLACT